MLSAFRCHDHSLDVKPGNIYWYVVNYMYKNKSEQAYDCLFEKL